MSKKLIISMLTILSIMLISIGIYACCVNSNKLETLFHKIENEQIDYEEIGIVLNGIRYNNPLTSEALTEINQDIIENLSHDVNCHFYCHDEHDLPHSTVVENEVDTKQMWSYLNEEDWNVEVNIKNQEDKNFNTYLTIKATGTNVSMLDMLYNRANQSFKSLKITPTETIYFKGKIDDRLTQSVMETLGDDMLRALGAKKTNAYIDDLTSTTRVYYGYTNDFKGAITEQNGEKSNVQIGFKYNEKLNQTEVIIAFPFYNELF